MAQLRELTEHADYHLSRMGLLESGQLEDPQLGTHDKPQTLDWKFFQNTIPS